jgi:hypothetical protein
VALSRLVTLDHSSLIGAPGSGIPPEAGLYGRGNDADVLLPSAAWRAWQRHTKTFDIDYILVVYSVTHQGMLSVLAALQCWPADLTICDRRLSHTALWLRLRRPADEHSVM